ncbi:hypothetical protein GGP77_003086 [Salinibacter ruber]|uniref:hypothetical protein n=1 Tax=Salinibacter ruber TaxID=146919 RepID=UPI00216851AD|nr:hypothetical protein [Salinibacter ruber]MCS3668832.1 hypothetical protein [Salinibacter ruber]
MDSPTEREHRLNDVANAAHIAFSVVRGSETNTAALHMPYGKAVVHLDAEGADVKLPSGATVYRDITGLLSRFGLRL